MCFSHSVESNPDTKSIHMISKNDHSLILALISHSDIVMSWNYLLSMQYFHMTTKMETVACCL